MRAEFVGKTRSLERPADRPPPMIQMLRNIKEQGSSDAARFKRRGHKGLTVGDLRLINRIREIGEDILARPPQPPMRPPKEDPSA